MCMKEDWYYRKKIYQFIPTTLSLSRYLFELILHKRLGQKQIHTIYFHFTEFVICISGISSRVRGVRSIVVINYNSAADIPWACYINGIRYCCFCVVAILKAKYSILFVGCVWYENWEPKKSRGHTVKQTYNRIFTRLIIYVENVLWDNIKSSNYISHFNKCIFLKSYSILNCLFCIV